MQKKVVFLDVDGTLCNDLGKIPESAVSAVQKARENGHLVYLCTGRSRAEILPEIWEIGIDGLIGAGGSYLEMNDRVVFHHTFPEDELLKLQQFLAENGVAYYLESNQGLFASPNLKGKIKEVIEQNTNEVVDFSWFFELLKEDFSKMDASMVNKVSFVNNTVPFEKIAEKYQDTFQMMRSTVPMFGTESGEIALKGHDKKSAIQYLLELLELDIENSIAIGDGENDIPMFEAVGKSYAVANAHPKLLEVSDEVTEIPDNQGIYLAFRKEGLIN